MQQPSISLLGIRIDEPVNMFTDLIVAAVCLIAYYKLTRLKLPGKTQRYFRLYFLLMGLATFFGGVIGHGFLYAFSFAWKLPGWILSMFSIALIERSSIENARPLIDPRIGKSFLTLNIIELIIVMTITIYTLNFKWVEFHSGYGLLAVVLTFHGFVYLRTRNPGSSNIIIGVGIASIAALIFMNEISPHIWFNHIDLSHVLMAVAAQFFYRGALKLSSPSPQPN
ncbi:MAG: hypothetical protein KF860_13370 [Cyclobacteriaceae bacterium]|nr:hypothetical protein [Cyclobacteriaceae bacterium]